MTNPCRLILGVALGVMLVAWGTSSYFLWNRAYDRGAASVQTKLDRMISVAAAERLAASEKNRQHEAAQAKKMAEIDAKHVQEMIDANNKFNTTIAQLRSGELRLRQRWQSCPRATPEAPGASASAGKLNAGADDREASAARIVSIGANADATIRALQAIVRADRAENP